MKLKRLFIFTFIVLIFLVGWFSNEAFSVTKPVFIEGLNSFKFDGKEKPSPYNWISKDKIKVYDNKILIDLQGAEWSEFANTNSMDPVLDEYSNAIEIIPRDEGDVHLGDIIAYESEYFDGVISHRVVDVREDEKGWYVKAKGDNNSYSDPGKIRFNQIKGVVVAVIY